jgi:membrane protein DedA with SNARE-associated domain
MQLVLTWSRPNVVAWRLLLLIGAALASVGLYHAAPALFLIAVATFVSEDLTTIHVGVLARQGHLGFISGTLACFAGIFVGDVLLYLAGRYAGRAALSRAPLKWVLSESAVARSSQWLEQRGALVILLSRFVPGMRLPTYFAAGALRTSFKQFVVYFLIACAVWTPLLVALAAWLGERFVADALQRDGLALFFFALSLGWLLRALLQLTTWRGRRLWLGRWRRWTHWEFWPLYVVYPPVVVYALWLALKHRSLTAFMSANPAIPTGGFVGESKSAILDGLRAAGDHVARYTLLSAESSISERLTQAHAFMAAHRLSFPIVFKPDIGQRGAGVRVLHSENELHAALRAMATAHILQEYVAGLEFGVFYYRFPHEAQGRIFSLTEKRFPRVTGDGVRTLEELVLADERAVCLAATYAKGLAPRWQGVISRGESVTLAELGSHCRGAIFLDGAHYQTPALAAAVEHVSRSFQGFYFGRYDIRAASLNDFQQGRFKVIELNGVAAEATHIYDPRYRVWQAYRVLLAQWRIAFAIGAVNLARR